MVVAITDSMELRGHRCMPTAEPKPAIISRLLIAERYCVPPVMPNCQNKKLS
jgi:hypothetical protein